MVTSNVHIVMPHHVNGTQRLFGGQLMAWIDVVAAVEARRHALAQVTTVAVDHLTFLRPAHLDETVRLDARVTWTGRTSLEVCVESYVEPLDGGDGELINVAYLVFVALGPDEKPCAVPAFTPSNAHERADWDAAAKRSIIRKTNNPKVP